VVPHRISKPLKSLINLVSSSQQSEDKRLFEAQGLLLNAIDTHDQVLRSLEVMSYMQTLLDDDQTYGIARHCQYLLESDMSHQLGEMRESLDRLRNLLLELRDYGDNGKH
jgi:hypothetical protein